MDRRRAHLRILIAAGLVELVAPAAISAQPVFSVLHSFSDAAGGSRPDGALIQATDGNFYGTTSSGGAFNAGTVFRMTPAGTVTVLHAFTGRLDGCGPLAALIEATDGTFYGTTSGLSQVPCFNQCGKVFRMTPAGGIEYVHRFTGGADGSYPSATLIQAADGNFYGLTSSGGGPPCASFFSFPFPCHGTVFKMTPTGIVTNLHAFTGEADGTEPSPSASLVQASDGSIYGTTPGGGEFGRGVVFRFIMTPHLLDLNGDGRGDVFLYNQATGERRIESANGLTTGFTETSGRWDPAWQVYPVDLNRDPFTDVFLYDPSRGLWAQALNVAAPSVPETVMTAAGTAARRRSGHHAAARRARRRRRLRTPFSE